MSQTDYVVANASGAAFRADLNDQLGAIATQNSGSSFPGTTFSRMVVVNTTTGAKYRRNLANSGWIVIDTDDETRVVSRSSNTILDLSDYSKTFIFTSSFTQTFDAVATLGDNWHIDVRNDGTGNITLDPNGSETINGATSFTLTAGASGRIVCNGSALIFISLSKAPTTQVFGSSGTWTKPTGLRDVWIVCKGAGGGGASSTTTGNGGGGGEGTTSHKRLAAAALGSTESVTIGSGGAGVAPNVNASGSTGGTSSFGSHCSAAGGVGGTSGNNGGAGGAGGLSGTGDWFVHGAPGQTGADSTGASVGINALGGGNGGSSGNASSNSGAGGGSGSASAPSGGGGSGLVVIIEYY